MSPISHIDEGDNCNNCARVLKNGWVPSLEGSVPIIKDGYAVAVALLAGTIFLSMVFLPGALTHTVGLGGGKSSSPTETFGRRNG